MSLLEPINEREPKTVNMINRRMMKALTEDMFLLTAHNHLKGWLFFIKGIGNKKYKILISQNRFGCECADFQYTENCCKHIYFIVGRVLKDLDMMKSLNSLNPWSEELNTKLFKFFRFFKSCQNENCLKDKDGTIVKKKHGEENKEIYSSSQNLKQCSICYDDISSKDLKWSCKTCTDSNFHENCINLWFIKTCHKRTGIPHCPICRTSIIKIKENCDITKFNICDPMLHFTEFTSS
jgi:hypothetical protein